MTTRAYPAIAFRQTQAPDAPWLVLFVASAEDLLTWVGIPRRSEGDNLGFQRIDDPVRIQRTKEFFNLPPNQSPTALILGIHPSPEGQVPAVKLSFGMDEPPDRAIRSCKLEVSLAHEYFSQEEIVARVRSQLDSRLSSEPEQSGSRQYSEEIGPNTDSGDEDEDDVESEEGDFSTSKTDGLDLTHSVLHRVRALLDDPDWVVKNLDAITDLSKPAMLIDGQHRILGAAQCERNIPFAVCAIFDCSWPEQVFQFTVVNYSAEGIPDQFITANAALSLTETELSSLQTRLVQARVKVIEYELMRFVQFDPESAFYNLVNMSERKDHNRIGYKTMVRVAREWYLGKKPVLKNILLPALFPSGRVKVSARERFAYWKEELWGRFFIDFWRVVRDHYQPHLTESGASLWTPGESNLMIAIVLYEFQNSFFLDLNGQDEEFFHVPEREEPIAYLRAKLRARATKFVNYYPPRFFSTLWGTKSLNTSAGRKALQGALQRLLQEKGKYQYVRSALVTGEIG